MGQDLVMSPDDGAEAMEAVMVRETWHDRALGRGPLRLLSHLTGLDYDKLGYCNHGTQEVRDVLGIARLQHAAREQAHVRANMRTLVDWNRHGSRRYEVAEGASESVRDMLHKWSRDQLVDDEGERTEDRNLIHDYSASERDFIGYLRVMNEYWFDESYFGHLDEVGYSDAEAAMLIRWLEIGVQYGGAFIYV